ncbi:hypothetical protein GDO81_026130 [Engystomops pustulosus]|uniref:Uncharacterized protein n=1 Tax=Engystomops pustulosus TaxID=76066 RepID=A0AAV6ZUV5_ENGPU|nr:hypothetical protein GDO81_026130 [Engystomops pustulosus]
MMEESKHTPIQFLSQNIISPLASDSSAQGVNLASFNCSLSTFNCLLQLIFLLHYLSKRNPFPSSTCTTTSKVLPFSIPKTAFSFHSPCVTTRVFLSTMMPNPALMIPQLIHRRHLNFILQTFYCFF